MRYRIARASRHRRTMQRAAVAMPCVIGRRYLCGGKRKPDIRDAAKVSATAKKQRADEDARKMAQWATHWMMPWERAQMDVPARPLNTWERVYWRLFLVFGTTGFLYETYVLQNRRVLRNDTPRSEAYDATEHSHQDRAFKEHRLLTDEDVQRAHNRDL